MDVELVDNLSDTNEFTDQSYIDHENMINSKLQYIDKQIPSMSVKNKVAKNG
jgi:hypothetical protein